MRFGEIVGGELLANQGAENNGRYDFWRDVRRLELVCGRFNLNGGLAVFVTNDTNYLDCPQEGSRPQYAAFSMRNKQKIGGQCLEWGNGAATAQRPNFFLAGQYQIQWKPADDENITLFSNRGFKYCILQVPPDSSAAPQT